LACSSSVWLPPSGTSLLDTDLPGDDIYPSPSAINQTPHLSVVGGAGTYSAIGARLLSPPPTSTRIGWIVDCGTDFPPELRIIIESWGTGVLMRERDGLTTKGWNGYGENDHRDFRYLTPKLRLDQNDLSESLLTSKSFHLICSASRCSEMAQGIRARRQTSSLPPAPLIWEPVPDLCAPSELSNTLSALQHVDVISPNHTELASLCSVSATKDNGEVDRLVVEKCCRQLIEGRHDKTRPLVVVVRSGKDGCCVVTTNQPIPVWLPAYHDHSQERVVDPTGGGNGFLGGFGVGLVRTGDPVKASVWGAVSASYCVEQVGVPTLTASLEGCERWNDSVVEDRLVEFASRCGIDNILSMT